MDFKTAVKITHVDVPVEDYFEGTCPNCGSKLLRVRSSYKRVLPDLGAPREQRFIRIKINYYDCEACGSSFSPKHPDYPSKLEYSPSIILYALERYYRGNVSAYIIADVLRTSHHVEVAADTIHTWIKQYSSQYLKSIEQEKTITHPESIKTVSIDGTYINAGKDVIGKKKPVVLLSVNKEKSGTYLITWSERKA